MIIFLSFIDNIHLSMYLNAEGSKNKMESKGFSTIYKSLSVKVNSRPLSLVSCSGCFNLITRRSGFVRRNFSAFKDILFGKFLYNFMFLNKSIITVKPYRLSVIPSHLAYSSEGFLERSCNGFTNSKNTLRYVRNDGPGLRVLQRLINSGLLYLSSPVKKIFKQINQGRFYSSPAALHLVPSQLTGQYLIKLDP